MPSETIKITPTPASISKTNWVKQIYFYIVFAFSLLFFCGGLFGTSQALLVRYVFLKAGNSFGYYPPHTNTEQQCKNGMGSPFWSPKMSMLAPDPSKPYTPTPPTEVEIKECIEVTNKGIEEQKDQSYQSGMLSGILALIISSLVGGIHYKSRGFFLGKE